MRPSSVRQRARVGNTTGQQTRLAFLVLRRLEAMARIDFAGSQRYSVEPIQQGQVALRIEVRRQGAKIRLAFAREHFVEHLAEAVNISGWTTWSFRSHVTWRANPRRGFADVSDETDVGEFGRAVDKDD